MEATKRKQIPYCIFNYGSIRRENYVYVDKTRFIELLEKEPTKYHFLIRPRKFGKTLFLSTLEHYYDIRFADEFKTLFGDLYIGQRPTPTRNSFFVMFFSFSGLDTSTVEDFKVSFTGAIKGSIQRFLTEHRSVIKDFIKLKEEAKTLTTVRDSIEFALDIIAGFERKAYIIIDEYDHFANDLIAQGTNLTDDQYKKLIWANGVVRDFYETLKDNSRTVIEKIFITGITPIMLDDVTSGFNISDNISLDVRYNELLGFTEKDVEFLIDECGINREHFHINIKYWYNGYLFHEDAEHKLYNSAMMLYFLYQTDITKGKVKRLIDSNLRTDYGRIQFLLNKPENIEKLTEITEFNAVTGEIIDRFSIDKIHDPDNFLSLLYYMGLITIDKEPESGNSLLRIPNYSVKTMYWDYMKNIIKDQNPKEVFDTSLLDNSLSKMAFQNDYKPFFEKFQKEFVTRLSNRDMENFSEKNVKFFLLSIFFQSYLYQPLSETENSQGYSDIYLQRRNDLYPTIKNDWVLELKYVKQADIKKDKIIQGKKADAIAQIQRYKTSHLFKTRTDVRYLMVVYIGKKDFLIEEI